MSNINKSVYAYVFMSDKQESKQIERGNIQPISFLKVSCFSHFKVLCWPWMLKQRVDPDWMTSKPNLLKGNFKEGWCNCANKSMHLLQNSLYPVLRDIKLLYIFSNLDFYYSTC